MKKRINLILLECFLFLSSFAQTYQPTYFSKKDFLEDIDFLTQKVTHIHPAFLNPEFKQEWMHLHDSIISDINDSLSFNECYSCMVPLLSTLRDGHTGFFPSYSERIKFMQQGGTTFPFTVKLEGDKLFIDQYLSENRELNLEGLEILSINLIPSTLLLSKIRKLCESENLWMTNELAEKYFGIWFWMVFGEQKEYSLELSDPTDKISISLSPVVNNRYFELKNKYYPQNEEKRYDISFWDDNQYACMKIKSFADNTTLCSFLKYAFDTIRQTGCPNLLIDIRGNGGGNSQSVDSLMNYLTNKEYIQYSSIKLRISQEIKDYYLEKHRDVYEMIKALPVDSLFSFSDSLFVKTPVCQPNHFKGNIYVLTNEKTFSGAATFAGVTREYHLGTLIGQPTGGKIFYYGDFLVFKLPNTGLQFYVSPKEFVQFGGDDLNSGVKPDLELTNLNYTIPEIIDQIKGNLR